MFFFRWYCCGADPIQLVRVVLGHYQLFLPIVSLQFLFQIINQNLGYTYNMQHFVFTGVRTDDAIIVCIACFIKPPHYKICIYTALQIVCMGNTYNMIHSRFSIELKEKLLYCNCNKYTFILILSRNFQRECHECQVFKEIMLQISLHIVKLVASHLGFYDCHKTIYC